MSDLAPVFVNCVLCRHPNAEAINKRLAKYGTAATMRWMQQNDITPIPHRNTFSDHKNKHLTSEIEHQKQQAIRQLERQQQTIKAKAGDLAQLVRDNVFARVEEGTLEPSMSDGLRAQEMLDRRSEKQGDRDMMLQLAGLLSGATSPVALLREPSIEGQYVVLDGDERAEDERAFALLASG